MNWKKSPNGQNWRFLTFFRPQKSPVWRQIATSGNTVFGGKIISNTDGSKGQHMLGLNKTFHKCHS